jgi:hypothetical protein
MSDPAVGHLGKALAWICHRCPVCVHGRAHPASVLGRILRHPLHADHCALWKAEQVVYGEDPDIDPSARR